MSSTKTFTVSWPTKPAYPQRQAMTPSGEQRSAGSIKLDHADMLFEINPTLIGVRGAVCEGKTRKSAISPDKTRSFVEYFHSKGAVSYEIAS